MSIMLRNEREKRNVKVRTALLALFKQQYLLLAPLAQQCGMEAALLWQRGMGQPTSGPGVIMVPGVVVDPGGQTGGHLHWHGTHGTHICWQPQELDPEHPMPGKI
jgi:hypothetical protein